MPSDMRLTTNTSSSGLTKSKSDTNHQSNVIHHQLHTQVASTATTTWNTSRDEFVRSKTTLWEGPLCTIQPFLFHGTSTGSTRTSSASGIESNICTASNAQKRNENEVAVGQNHSMCSNADDVGVGVTRTPKHRLNLQQKQKQEQQQKQEQYPAAFSAAAATTPSPHLGTSTGSKLNDTTINSGKSSFQTHRGPTQLRQRRRIKQHRSNTGNIGGGTTNLNVAKYYYNNNSGNGCDYSSNLNSSMGVRWKQQQQQQQPYIQKNSTTTILCCSRIVNYKKIQRAQQYGINTNRCNQQPLGKQRTDRRFQYNSFQLLYQIWDYCTKPRHLENTGCDDTIHTIQQQQQRHDLRRAKVLNGDSKSTKRKNTFCMQVCTFLGKLLVASCICVMVGAIILYYDNYTLILRNMHEFPVQQRMIIDHRLQEEHALLYSKYKQPQHSNQMQRQQKQTQPIVPWTVFYNVYMAIDPFIASIDKLIIMEQLEQIGMSYANLAGQVLLSSTAKEATNEASNHPSSRTRTRMSSAVVEETNSTLLLKLYFNTIGRRSFPIKWFKELCWTKYRIRCIHMGHYKKATEEVTLDRLYQFCQKEQQQQQYSEQNNNIHSVIYLHNKGSFHPTLGGQDRWRRTMTAAVTSNLCLDALHSTTKSNNNCNACGMLFQPLPAPHFPGNMWVAQCSYISQLVSLHMFHEKKRHVDEWITYETNVLGTMSSNPIFPLEGHYVGRDRYESEHWVGSHPAIEPCDISASSSKNYWLNEDRNFTAEFQYSVAPRNPHTDRDWDWYSYTTPATKRDTETARIGINTSSNNSNNDNTNMIVLSSEENYGGNRTMLDPIKRLRDYYLFRGMIYKWLVLYGPPSIQNQLVRSSTTKTKYDYKVVEKWNYKNEDDMYFDFVAEKHRDSYDDNFHVDDDQYIPKSNSWIWSWYPDGKLWKHAVSMYGPLDAMNRLTIIPVPQKEAMKDTLSSSSSLSSSSLISDGENDADEVAVLPTMDKNHPEYSYGKDTNNENSQYYYFLNLTTQEYNEHVRLLHNYDKNQSAIIKKPAMNGSLYFSPTRLQNQYIIRWTIQSIEKAIEPFLKKYERIQRRRRARRQARTAMMTTNNTPVETNTLVDKEKKVDSMKTTKDNLVPTQFLSLLLQSKRLANQAMIKVNNLSDGLIQIDGMLYSKWISADR